MEYHIQCNEEDIARYTILPRDPEKARKISKLLDNCKFVSDSRGYYVYTGYTDHVRVTVSSTGIGGPQLAIGAEELAHMGSDTFIRVDACQPLQEGLQIGYMIIPLGSYRGGTTANHYLPLPFPAAPDFKMLSTLVAAAKKLGSKIHLGINVSVDAIFAHRDDKFQLKCQDAHALSLDMETDTLFVISSDNQWRSGAILVVSPATQGENLTHINAFTQGEDTAFQIAFEAIKSFALKDDKEPTRKQIQI